MSCGINMLQLVTNQSRNMAIEIIMMECADCALKMTTVDVMDCNKFW